MFLQQLSFIILFSLTLLQPNGCSSKKQVQQPNQNTQTRTTPTPKTDDGGEKGEQNKMDLLKQKVLNKEQRAVNLAQELGKSAIPVLIPLAENSDEDVRRLALNCLRYTGGGGDQVESIFIESLKDDSINVTTEAVKGLQQYLSSAIYTKLLEVYDEVKVGTRRKDIALMLGKIENAKIADLKEKYENEKDAEAKEGLMVALAKLGDGQAAEEFTNRLHKAEKQELKKFLEYVEYIEKTWALKALSPILSNKTPLIYIGVDGIDDGNAKDLRACDIAVNLIYKMVKPKFSFEVRGNKNYSDAELQQVKSFLNTIR